MCFNIQGSVVGSTIDQDFGWVSSDKGGPVDAFRKMVKILDVLEEIDMTYEPWLKIPEAPGITCGTIRAGRGRDYDPRGSSTFADFCTAMGGLLQVAKVPGILTVCYDSVRVEIRLGWEVRKWAN